MMRAGAGCTRTYARIHVLTHQEQQQTVALNDVLLRTHACACVRTYVRTDKRTHIYICILYVCTYVRIYTRT